MNRFSFLHAVREKRCARLGGMGCGSTIQETEKTLCGETEPEPSPGG